jgi:hypothetical protein
MNYIYYIMEANIETIFGVISETEKTVTFQQLSVQNVINTFNNSIERHLRPYSCEHTTDKSESHINRILSGELVITKDYWTAFEHATGERRKAITENAIG